LVGGRDSQREPLPGGIPFAHFLMPFPSLRRRIMPRIVDPVEVPDVATEPHPRAHAMPPEAGAGVGALQAVLPEVNQLAQKVGGFKKLAEIAGQMDGDGEGKAGA
jgi:hypothetical protein